MQANKIMIVKIRKLATQNFLFNIHAHFPFGSINRLSRLWKICLNIIIWNIGIVCFIIELHQFTSDTPYIPHICKIGRSLYHSRDRIVTASRSLQIYTQSANPIGAVLSCFFLLLFLQHSVFRYEFWLKWKKNVGYLLSYLIVFTYYTNYECTLDLYWFFESRTTNMSLWNHGMNLHVSC